MNDFVADSGSDVVGAGGAGVAWLASCVDIDVDGEYVVDVVAGVVAVVGVAAAVATVGAGAGTSLVTKQRMTHGC